MLDNYALSDSIYEAKRSSKVWNYQAMASDQREDNKPSLTDIHRYLYITVTSKDGRKKKKVVRK